MIENIVFDLDGTLVDSSEDIIECLKMAYKLAGIEVKVAIDKSLIGPPITEMVNSITNFLSDEQRNIVVRNFRRYYNGRSYEKTILFSGVRELLEGLKEMGIRMFVVTNKPTNPTREILDNLKVDYFHYIVCIDSLNGISLDKESMISYLMKKWNLDKTTTIVVGDSVSDIIMAHHNGLTCVSISSGYGNVDDMKKNNPDYILDEVKDLLDLVNDINNKKSKTKEVCNE